jgi:hypothetical protein
MALNSVVKNFTGYFGNQGSYLPGVWCQVSGVSKIMLFGRSYRAQTDTWHLTPDTYLLPFPAKRIAFT